MLKLLRKEIWQYLQKSHIHLLFDETITLLGIHPKGKMAKILKRYTNQAINHSKHINGILTYQYTTYLRRK